LFVDKAAVAQDNQKLIADFMKASNLVPPPKIEEQKRDIPREEKK
jgi:hypothetical protein